MKRMHAVSFFLIGIFLLPAFAPVVHGRFICYIFYDATSQNSNSLQLALDTIGDVCKDYVTLIRVPVSQPSDMHIKQMTPASAFMLFHGTDNGLELTNDYLSTQLFSWTELGQFIDSTNFREYYILACHSTNVDGLTSKERVLTFDDTVDAKVAAIVALLKLQMDLRSFSLDASKRVFDSIVSQIEDDRDFLIRLFAPRDFLGAYGIEKTAQHGLIVKNLEYLRDSVHAQTQLIISKKSYMYTVELAFEEIMNLVTSEWYGFLKDTGGTCAAILEDLWEVVDDMIDGEISVSTFESALSAVLTLWDLAWIGREMVPPGKIRDILMWADLPFFVASVFYTLCSVSAQVEDTDYGDRNIYSDSLAIVMDDEEYRKHVFYGALPQSTSVCNALDNLIAALEGTFDYENIRNKAEALKNKCDDALLFAGYIGGDTEYYTKILLEAVKDAAESIYDSGAEYLDQYAGDNYYYEMDWSVKADWWTAKLTIKYDFKNPACNQVPIYRIWNKFTETRHGDSRSKTKHFSYYLLPGSHYGEEFKLKYDGWKGWRVTFSWSITIRYWIDLYGEYKSSHDSDGDGMSDYDELWSTFGYRTCPTRADTDYDSYNDKWEIDNGYNPLDPFSPRPWWWRWWPWL